jgi:hypothetical protein
MAFKKAVKSQAKLRAAVFGPSGAGKTYTALEIASGIVSVIGGNIALIDSERSTASKYADRFVFDQDDLVTKDIDEYVKKINEAAEAGYSVLIIDSLTHAWQMLLDSVEKLAQAKYKGNSWSAWSEGTPEQRKLVDAIVSFPGHIIATMRSKTEWQTTTNDRGKTTPVRVGLAPEQGKGIEYEFDILFELSPDHLAHIIKDRSGKFQDKIIEKPGKKFGQELIAWLNEGTVVPPPQKTDEQRLKDAFTEIGTILDSEDFGKRIFTVEEKDVVREKIKKGLADIPKEQIENKIFFANEIMDEIKKLLHQRISGDSGAVETGTEKQEVKTPASNPVPETPKTESPTAKQTGSEQPPSDDGFVDDIPWADGEEPSRKGSRKSSKSKTSGASEELEIF